VTKSPATPPHDRRHPLPKWLYRSLSERLVNWLLVDKSKFRTLILTLFVLLTTAIMPNRSITEYQAILGSRWPESDLIAPFDYPITKDAKQLQLEREHQSNQMPLMFVEQTNLPLANRQKIEADIQRVSTQLQVLARQSNQSDAALQSLSSEFSVLSKADWTQLSRRPLNEWERLVPRILALYDSIYTHGVIDRDKNEIKLPFVSLRITANKQTLRSINRVLDNDNLIDLISKRFPDPNAKFQLVAKSILFRHCKPNYFFDEAIFKAEQAAVLNNVLPYLGTVKRGELIVAQGQIIDRQTASKISSLNTELLLVSGKAHAFGWAKKLGQLMMILLLTVVTVMFLRIHRKSLYHRRRSFTLLFLVFFVNTALIAAVQVIVQHVAVSPEWNLLYLAPLLMAPIMLTIFFDDKLGFFSNVILSILASLVCDNNFELLFVYVLTGSFTIFQIKILKKRSQFFTTAGVSLAAFLVSYVSFHWYVSGSLVTVPYQNCMLIVLNVAFSLGTYPLIYLIERVFGITSELTFMELLDTDHPLLKELANLAPGTYQHSLQVANIAEEAAKRVGANPVLVHVGALFHDIGKMDKAEYFTENQIAGQSAHSQLTPLESAKMIISHVELGVEKARAAKLPEEIVQFIQTHHGQSRVEFFYRQHITLHPEDANNPAIERQFRYPGPKPTTKEMAIVMISDSIEAASRSLEEPTGEDIERLVDAIIGQKIKDNQLVMAHITFRDVSLIRDELCTILKSIHHSRIKYPEPVTTAAE
jgi:cyclic-di-AMP phosphodiesterase PgpH